MPMIPVLGPVRENSGRVTATPQYARWPLLGGNLLVAFQMTASQQVALSVKFTDSKGNPASVDGVPQWLIDNPNVVALQPAPDGLSCTAVAMGPLGTVTVSMRADADLGAGSEEIIGTFDMQIVAGQATLVQITAGAPVEQP